MELLELEKGWAIKFRFELKDAFREAFPTAKWNAAFRHWEMGVRAKKKLETWMEEIAAADAALAELADAKDAVEWSSDEITRMKASIEQVLFDANKARSALPGLESLAAEKAALAARMAEVEAQLAEARGKVTAAKQAVAKEEASMRQKMAGIVDFSALDAAFKKMRWAHGGVGSTNRRAFDEAQAVIKEQIDNLAEAGWGNTGLDWAWRANFNRADRDNLGRMPAGAMDDWYEIESE